jgi:hypothetical protein
MVEERPHRAEDGAEGSPRMLGPGPDRPSSGTVPLPAPDGATQKEARPVVSAPFAAPSSGFRTLLMVLPAP